MERFVGRAGWLALLGAIGAYFAIGCTLTLEYIDEGQILYPSWLTSLGAVPYKDFGHMYGPALFFLNGALFRWFGPDLIVIRISLVFLRMVIVLLAYLVARRLASRPFALLACGILVALWGTPWWVFNTPYANHYSLALTLGGLLCFLSLPHNFLLSCVLAGLCFGLAATFKQTAGIFAFSGFAMFLILARDALERRELPAGPSLPAWCVRGARLATLVGMLAGFTIYLGRRDTIWNVVALFTPAVFMLGIATVRELRGPVERGMRVGLWGLLHAAAGAALPTLGIGIYYAARGLLPDLLFHLVRGLPQKVTVFEPFPVPDARALFSVVLPGVIFGAVGLARRHHGLARSGTATALGILSTAVLLLFANSWMRAAVLAYVQNRMWHGTILTLWFAVPLAAVWLTGLPLLRSSLRDARASIGSDSAVLLVYCNAVTALLLLYPVADVFHVVMGLPAFAPLWARLLERFHCAADHESGSPSRAGRYVSAGLIGALAACMAAPSVDLLITMFTRSRGETMALSKATGIRGSPPKFDEVARLVAYLEAEVPAQQDLLVLSCEQILYFLTSHRSALEENEFIFYLVGTGMLPDEDARRLIDQRQIIERLAATRPIIVEGGDDRTNGRLRRTFEEMSHYIDAHYEVAARVANYTVLTWVR